MTLTLTSTAGAVQVHARGAEALFGAAVRVRLAAGCDFRRALPGTLLSKDGEPLTLGGTRSDGTVLAATTLKRGDRVVSGDGLLLTIETQGTSCTGASTLLSATAYDAQGVAHDLATVASELPGSGMGMLLPMLLCAACAAAVLTHRRSERTKNAAAPG